MMMTNNAFPKNCKECENECDCMSAAYGVGTCKYRTQIENAALATFRAKEINENKIKDDVNEPSHYKHGTFEVIDEMVIVFGIDATIDFCRMNAWKYRARAPFKGDMEQDMAKANCYLEMAAKLQSIKDENFELLKGGIPDVKAG